ncbi:Uncharacterized protein GBIM_11143, partial [Gryllus bimaculatus]
ALPGPLAPPSERGLVAAGLLFSIVFAALVQGALVDLVANPRRRPDIDTLQQLDESQLPIATSDDEFLDTFSGPDSALWQRLARRLFLYSPPDGPSAPAPTTPTPSTTTAGADHCAGVASDAEYTGDFVRRVAAGRCAALLSEVAARRTLRADAALAARLHLAAACPRVYFEAYATPFASPLRRPVGRVVARALEAGLLAK